MKRRRRGSARDDQPVDGGGDGRGGVMARAKANDGIQL